MSPEKAQLLIAFKWARGRLGMVGWGIDLTISDEPPDWAAEDANGTPGLSDWSASAYEQGKIWVSPILSEVAGYSPIRTLMHEMLHGWAERMEIPGHTYDGWEREFNRLDAVLEKAYHGEARDGTCADAG